MGAVQKTKPEVFFLFVVIKGVQHLQIAFYQPFCGAALKERHIHRVAPVLEGQIRGKIAQTIDGAGQHKGGGEGRTLLDLHTVGVEHFKGHSDKDQVAQGYRVGGDICYGRHFAAQSHCIDLINILNTAALEEFLVDAQITVLHKVIHRLAGKGSPLAVGVIHLTFINGLGDFHRIYGDLLEGGVGSQGIVCQGVTLLGIVGGDIFFLYPAGGVDIAGGTGEVGEVAVQGGFHLLTEGGDDVGADAGSASYPGGMELEVGKDNALLVLPLETHQLQLTIGIRLVTNDRAGFKIAEIVAGIGAI